MARVAYTVTATFENPAVAEEWVGWLVAGHIAEVMARGAVTAEILEMDGRPRCVEVRYIFPSRAVFDHYDKEHAPRLRAEGIRRFPAERGIGYRRSIGVVQHIFPPSP
jgi:hypothetical protein